MNFEFSTILSFSLTLIIFSYLLRDNFLFRLALAVFVGLASAFTTIVVMENVLLPLIVRISSLSGNSLWINFIISLAIPISLTSLLVLKPIASLKSVTNIALAYLIGVGTAVAIAGAISGTLYPLLLSVTSIKTDMWGIINGVIGVVGVVTSLLYFQYIAKQNPDGTVERPPRLKWITRIGKAFIVMTLGAIYGTTILSSLTILTGQLSHLFGG